MQLSQYEHTQEETHHLWLGDPRQLPFTDFWGQKEPESAAEEETAITHTDITI